MNTVTEYESWDSKLGSLMPIPTHLTTVLNLRENSADEFFSSIWYLLKTHTR